MARRTKSELGSSTSPKIRAKIAKAPQGKTYSPAPTKASSTPHTPKSTAVVPTSSGTRVVSTPGNTPTRRRRPAPPTPQERAQAQIRRRVLSGKGLTPKQARVVRAKPKLETSLAKERLRDLDRPLKAELGLTEPVKATLGKPLLKKLAVGKGEAQLVKTVAQAAPKPIPKPRIRKAAKGLKSRRSRPQGEPKRPHSQKRRSESPPKGKRRGGEGKDKGRSTPGRIVKRALRSVDDPNARALAPAAIKAARKTGIPASVLLSLSGQESGYGVNQGPSSAGARGVTQFIPSTRETMIKEHGVDPWKDAKSGMLATGIYLNELGFKDDPQGALSGYSGDYAADAYNNPILQGAQEFKKLDRAAAAKGAKVGKVAGTSAPKKAKGAWAGSKAKVRETLKGLVDPSEFNDDKRTPEENSSVGGASDSDHLTSNTGSFAADIPPDAAVYAKLRKRLGLPPAETGMDSVTKDGYRYQLIFGSQYGHANHIHLGVRWEGADAPPGTSFGGPISSGATAGGAVGGATTTAPSGTTGTGTAAAASTKRRKRRKSKKPVAIPHLSEIQTPEVSFTPSEESYGAYLKKRSASVSL